MRQQIVIFTGAGFSKESGLSTFRDNDGVWSKYNPHYQTEHVYCTCFDTIECGCREIITKLKNGVEPIS